MFDRALRLLALGAGVVLLGLLGLVIFDVVMRYLLRLPFLGAYEMTELAMVLIVFLALPYCAATGGHVAVDVLSPLLDRPWPGLSPVERAVLLLAAFELSAVPEIPFRVVINEAVDLAKIFGGTDGHKYVNGVLDRVSRALRPAETA